MTVARSKIWRYVGLLVTVLVVACGVGIGFFFRTAQTALPLSIQLANVPEQLVVVGKVPPVEVYVEGPVGSLRDLKGVKLSYELDMQSATPGKTFFEIQPERIGVPEKVSVVGVDPGSFVVRLDTEQEKVLPVVPDLVGEPAPGYVVVSVKASPDRVRLKGAASLLEKISAARTTPVDLGGLKAPAKKAVALDLNDTVGIQVVEEGLIQIHVDIAESVMESHVRLRVRGIGTERKYSITPSHIEVVLRGPQSRFEKGGVEEAMIDARVDLTGLMPGTYFRHAVIEPPLDITVVDTHPKTFRIDVLE